MGSTLSRLISPPLRWITLTGLLCALTVVLSPAPLFAQSSARATLQAGLTLTVWGARLTELNPEGRPWDLNSFPDALARVYLNGRLINQSGVRRDTLTPLWALTIGPIPEARFLEGPVIVQVVDQDVLGEQVMEEFLISLPTQLSLGQIQELRGENITALAYQWGQLTTLPLRPQEEIIPLPATPLDTPSSTRSKEALQKRTARETANASSLYRAYLRAQFQGDQIEEHRILLKLARRYPHTRHGRKARRLILLDGR